MITLGVAARLAEEKGFEYLFEAMKRIESNIQLLVAGPIDPVGEEYYKNKIFKLIKELNIKVKFLGNLDQNKLKEFYKKIDILVLPSINSTESFGMVQVEAMFQGTPVVASNLPGVRIPILKTKMGELAEPENSESLARVIIEVYRNINTYRKRRQIALTTFDVNKSYEIYRDIILNI